MTIARARAAPTPGCLATRRRDAGVPIIAASSPTGTTSRPPSTTGGSGEIWRFELQLLQPLLQPPLQLVGTLAGFAELSRALGLPACSWSLSCSAR